MRLLYVIDSLAPGGAETSLAEMAPGLIAGGIQLHVLPLGDQLDLAPRLEEAGATVHTRDSQGGRVGSVRAVMNVARQVRPDLIHTTLYESDIAGRTAAWLLRLPASTSIVNDSYSPSHYAESNAAKLHAARALDAVTARAATRFHAISSAIANSVSSRLCIPRAKIEVIPRGRNPKDYPFRPTGLRDRTRRDLGIPPEAPVILAVGRLEPQKGLQHLLQALPAAAREHPGVVALIAGRDGRSSATLRAQAKELEVDVRFLGHRTDVPALMAAADVFCFPSEREGLGGVLIEAMAVGCPIVAASIPTSREVLGTGDESAGLLSPIGDASSLGRALNQAITAPGEAELRALRGRARFERLYSIDNIVRRTLAFFHGAAPALGPGQPGAGGATDVP